MSEKTEKKEEPVYLVFRRDGTSLIPLEKRATISFIEKYHTTEPVKEEKE